MATVLTLLKRYVILFSKNINNQISLYCLLPILVYGFMVSPLSTIFSFIDSSSMSYSYHSIPAVIFLCTSLIAIYTPIIFLNLDSQNQFQSYILSYTNKYIYFGSILIFSVICSYVEFFISFILIYNLSDSNSTMGIMITTFQIINFIIISLPSILFFVSIGILLSNFLTKFENIISFLIFVFLFISFGSSTFIPVDFYPEVLSNLISDYNLIYLQYNQLINILGNNNINLGLIIITLFLSVFFSFLNIICFKKKDEY
tara:strand:- start:6669 stop:7442 length:774 start_codon:yes stop_codon:yes gene_type:complete